MSRRIHVARSRDQSLVFLTDLDEGERYRMIVKSWGTPGEKLEKTDEMLPTLKITVVLMLHEHLIEVGGLS